MNTWSQDKTTKEHESSVNRLYECKPVKNSSQEISTVQKKFRIEFQNSGKSKLYVLHFCWPVNLFGIVHARVKFDGSSINLPKKKFLFAFSDSAILLHKPGRPTPKRGVNECAKREAEDQDSTASKKPTPKLALVDRSTVSKRAHEMVTCTHLLSKLQKGGWMARLSTVTLFTTLQSIMNGELSQHRFWP